MTTELIDLYLEYFEAATEAYAIPRSEPFKYSEYAEESEE